MMDGGDIKPISKPGFGLQNFCTQSKELLRKQWDCSSKDLNQSSESITHSTPIDFSQPVNPCSLLGLSFEDLVYTVLIRKKKSDGKFTSTKLDVLQGVTGYAPKGQLTAVMGPSGAGKTTLLDILAGRMASTNKQGSIKYDGRPVTTTLMKRVSTYILQDDKLFPMLSVLETFIFAAEWRLPRTVGTVAKRERVNELLEQLDLKFVQYSYIGDERRKGISGGEKRRVSIGLNIIHGPALLFLDEPTSGLDSTNALTVIEKLKTIATSGSTVIFSIHQPSHRIQMLFNHLIVLARGRVIYQGTPVKLASYLRELGQEVPRGESSIEYLMDLAHDLEKRTETIKSLASFYERYKRSPRLASGESTMVYKVSPVQLMDGKSPSKRLGLNASFSAGNLSELSDAAELEEQQENHSPCCYQHQVVNNVEEVYDQSALSPVGVPNFLDSHYYSNNIKVIQSSVAVTHSSTLMPKGTVSCFDRWSSLNGKGVRSCNSIHRLLVALFRGSVMLIFQINASKLEESDSNSQATGVHAIGCKYSNSWRRELLLLIVRNFNIIKRTPELFLFRQISIIIMGVITATLFWKTPVSPQGVTSFISFVVATISLFFFSANDSIPAFIQERFIILRETSQNAYRPSAYVIAGVITYLPFLALQAMSYTFISWWAVKLAGGLYSFCFFWLVLFVCLFTTNSFVFFMSSVFPNYMICHGVVITFCGLFYLTFGFFITRTNIPSWWIWLHYMSTMKYAYEALLYNQFQNNGDCYAPPINNQPCMNGTVILDSMGINMPASKWGDILVLLGWGIVYRFLFYIMLSFSSKTLTK